MRWNTRVKDRIVFAGKLLVGLLIVSPIVLGVLMSFMTPAELAQAPPALIPQHFAATTYQKAFRSVPLFSFMANSLLVAAFVIAGQILTCSLAAYAFSYFSFKGKNLIFLLILSSMMIPADAIIIANYLTICQLQLADTYLALVAPYLTSAMGIFLMRQSFLTVPKELKEAASLDGCTDFGFLIRILMPISIPSLAALGVYVFIQTYNQFFWPLLVTNSARMRTIQVGMSTLFSSEAVDYGVVLAGATITLVPIILVFILGQKYLIQGMTAGSVKG